MIAGRCDAYHDGHDCRTPGACTLALLEMLDRCRQRTDTDRIKPLDRRGVRA